MPRLQGRSILHIVHWYTRVLHKVLLGTRVLKMYETVVYDSSTIHFANDASLFDAEVVELVITGRRYVDSSIRPCKTDARGRELDGMEDAVITNAVHRKREW